jgi:hypothetical protein
MISITGCHDGVSVCNIVEHYLEDALVAPSIFKSVDGRLKVRPYRLVLLVQSSRLFILTHEGELPEIHTPQELQKLLRVHGFFGVVQPSVSTEDEVFLWISVKNGKAWKKKMPYNLLDWHQLRDDMSPDVIKVCRHIAEGPRTRRRRKP